jgi:hypothetical protein
MPGGVSPPGSTSLANCTCATQQARLLRGDAGTATLEELLLDERTSTAPPTNAKMYCTPPPPNSVYDAQRLRLGCRRGWTPVYYYYDAHSSSGGGAAAPSGKEKEDLLLQGCALCGRGRYALADPSTNNHTDDLQCVPCPVGNYTDRTDAIGGCTPCGPGLTTLAPGSVSPQNCTCPPGMARDSTTGRCTGCSIYEYLAPNGAGCVGCPDPHMLTMGGGGALSEEACLCGPGYARITTTTSARRCVPCAKGTYSMAASAAVACTPCPPGHTTDGVGAVRRSQCACDAAQGFVQISGLCRNASLLQRSRSSSSTSSTTTW